jgi:AmmeMemoRadiSam system protein B
MGDNMMQVRRPAVAGTFYPEDAAQLRTTVAQFLREASGGKRLPRAIIAPHAGYVYSGPIAASAYAHVAAGKTPYRRVVLLGPAHRVPVDGLAMSSADAFATPLGEVALDRDAIAELLALPQVITDDGAHRPEHGLEVHLPFLQSVLGSFSLVPIVVGRATAEEVAAVLVPFADDAETLIVVSSDLSHYQPYEIAKRLDRETSREIEMLQPLSAGQACGWKAINGLLYLAATKGWEAVTVDLRNSGDTAGPHHQVVGYGAYLFFEEPPILT